MITATAATTITIGQALEEARARLAHLESARLDADILLAAVLDCRREDFYARPERELPANRAVDFHALIERRSEGYPVAYLTGRREFWSLQCQVNSHTLIPRPETETLVEAALARIPEETALDILDLGTGSGAIALALAGERPACRITATDISREALAVAYENANAAGLSNIAFMESDWFSELERQRYHLIVSNPPYVESNYGGFATGEIRFEPRLALDGGPAGLDAIRRIIPAARRRLHPGGWLLLEHGHQQAEDTRGLLLAARYSDPQTLQDMAGLDRVTLAYAS
ncbi:MAG: peptide chain release factor N(5)-glutamine methyltransferase [Gammaproteobacteria bacterium]